MVPELEVAASSMWRHRHQRDDGQFQAKENPTPGANTCRKPICIGPASPTSLAMPQLAGPSGLSVWGLELDDLSFDHRHHDPCILYLPPDDMQGSVCLVNCDSLHDWLESSLSAGTITLGSTILELQLAGGCSSCRERPWVAC